MNLIINKQINKQINVNIVSITCPPRGFAVSHWTLLYLQGVTDDCHFQGTIRGVQDSSVVLNTCAGLR